MNYYNEIKDTLVKNEIYKKAKDYSKNKRGLNIVVYDNVLKKIVDSVNFDTFTSDFIAIR